MPIKPDQAIQHRERLNFARYLIEVDVDQVMPNTISFETEIGVIYEQFVHMNGSQPGVLSVRC